MPTGPDALHDALTGARSSPLVGAALPAEELAQLLRAGLSACRRQRRGLGLLWLEVDLAATARGAAPVLPPEHTVQVWMDVLLRLRRRVRATDHCMGLGDGRYAVLLNGADEAVALKVAERLRAALAEPHGLGPWRLGLSSRIGQACHPAHGQGAEELLDRAQRDLRA